jgi:DNA-binding CsgD family transcriptional regulator
VGAASRLTARSIRAASMCQRFLVRPYALVASRWQLAAAAGCTVMIGAVFLAEVLTPDVAVGSLGTFPVVAAMWVLSTRLAALVALLAVCLFCLAVIFEDRSRPTVILIAVTIFVSALMTRLYAASLATILARRRHPRPAVTAPTVPATLDGIDGFTHGIQALTRRELEVAGLAALGYTASEIGLRLHISGRTVESHLASTYARLRISSRFELVSMAPKLAALSHRFGEGVN